MKKKLFPMALVLALGLTACSETTRTNTVDNNVTIGDTTAVSGNNAATTPPVDPGLTLPVLDALFYEEGFGEELKNQLALSADQVEKLKAAAQKSVSDLDEKGDGTAYLGSARAASQNAEKQLNSILGEEKAMQLRQYVARRYASGDLEGLLPTQPNAVPTDTRVVVNAPAYRMDVFQDGRLLKSYAVGIGYPEFPLPAGMRRAEKIIFNPTWTPPDEPWVRGKFAPGKTVAAGSKDNPLGPIKIPIGLPSLIHGGKQPAKLGNFASHGCVGLTNEGIQDFATTLAQISGASSLTPDAIQNYGTQKGKTTEEKLPKPVPIELRYETIVAGNGGLTVYRDVYERGTNTTAYANKVLQVYNLSYNALPAAEKSALVAALTEMNRDAQGNAIADEVETSVADTTTGAEKPNTNPKGKVTRTVKGQKEVFVPIAALSGKGYPAPVNLVGGAPQTPRTAGK